jgi:hypothetical protein
MLQRYSNFYEKIAMAVAKPFALKPAKTPIKTQEKFPAVSTALGNGIDRPDQGLQDQPNYVADATRLVSARRSLPTREIHRTKCHGTGFYFAPPGPQEPRATRATFGSFTRKPLMPASR